MGNDKQINIENWVELKLAEGRYSFSLLEVKNSFSERSEDAVKLALNRLTNKQKILSIYKGYYIIIPPQYFNLGFLPVQSFIDQFMNFLDRKYYVSLLSAAALHGSSHQQPQEYFVTTTRPVLRPTKKKHFKINYTGVQKFPDKMLVKMKTETGYLSVSNPLLTAVDLLHFVNKIGGLNRASTVIYGLSEVISPNDISTELIDFSSVVCLQRLGFIFEYVCNRIDLADSLFNKIQKRKIKFHRTPLSQNKGVKSFDSFNRWNVIVNTEIEIDE